MNSNELRQKFIKFFVDRGHKELPAASLIPENDPSVLFTTAGMQQFKKFYINPEESKYSRAVTVQKCIRTADIDEVGDRTHHTFLEMLGNFSFGYPNKKDSYFKKEAIEFAWEFLTKTLGISSDRIHATYFNKADRGIAITLDADTESKEILDKIEGLKKVEPRGEDNFWSLGTEKSPGGRTVEFYVDNIEVWNLVFNEMVRKGDHWEDLEFKGVDTGMGFERLLAVLGNKSDNYQTDLFWPLIQKIEKLTKLEYGDKVDEDYIKDGKQCWVDVRRQMRIIVDHIKAAVFAINEGILPSNKDTGYIVRRLIRRAIVKGAQLKIENNFIKDIAKKVYEIYEGVYDFDTEKIDHELGKEETQFKKTLSLGMKQFEKTAGMGTMPAGTFPAGMEYNVLTGKELFDLYQTYGFPLELSLEIAKNKNTPLEEGAVDNFNNELKKHQDLSRTASAGMFRGGLVGESPITTRMHTATHLLLKALQEVLGPDVHQRGSNINEERIRFDFSYPKPMTDEEIKKVEDIVNKKIKEDIPVVKKETTVEEAKKLGAEAQFVEKYAQYGKLTMYSIDDYSHELCGGPHVKSTGEIGKFKITKEESSSSGVRRIRAILE